MYNFRFDARSISDTWYATIGFFKQGRPITVVVALPFYSNRRRQSRLLYTYCYATRLQPLPRLVAMLLRLRLLVLVRPRPLCDIPRGPTPTPGMDRFTEASPTASARLALLPIRPTGKRGSKIFFCFYRAHA